MSVLSRIYLRKSAATIAILLFAFVSAWAAKQFVMPRPLPAAQYPAHDSHPMEKVTVAIDPYDTEAKQKELFAADYLGHSFLPVFVVITNDGDQPITLTNIKFDLLTRDKAKAVAVNETDLYRRFSNTKHYEDKSSGAKRVPYPIPLPKGDKGPVKKELRDEFDACQFWAKAVEPHGTQAGFVFFDIGDLKDPARGATITVTNLKDANGNLLMYFEVPLDKSVNAPK